MSNPIIRIHDIQTNEVIDREMTDEEFEAYQMQKAQDKIQTESEALKAKTKADLLQRLGITEDEAKLLFG